MKFRAQNDMLERLAKLTAPIPSHLAARGVAAVTFSLSGDLLVIKASLFDRPKKRHVTATYYEPEWWSPGTREQAEKLAGELFNELKSELERS